MKKNWGIVFSGILFLSLVSCNQNRSVESAGKVTIQELLANPEKYIDKKVVVKGTVSHVCHRTGEKLFLVDSLPNVTLRITTGPNIAKFDTTMEGKKIQVAGVFKELRIDEAYLNKLEQDKTNVQNKEHHSGDSSSLHKNEATQGNIQRLHEEIASSSEGFISDHWIETEILVPLD